MANRTLNLTDELYAYMQSIAVRENNVLAHLRRVTQALPGVAKMQISPEQGQFMAFIAEMLGARKTLDIGTFTGYSALAVADVLPASGKVIACDVNEEWTGIAKTFWQQAGLAHKIELRLAPALDTLDSLIDAGEANSFDFIFIDADKANYPHYYEKSFQLLSKGGIIALDNVFMGGKVINPNEQSAAIKGVRALNEIIKNDKRIKLTLVPIGDGLSLLRK